MMTRDGWARVVWVATAVWAAFLLASVKTGWLDSFFYDTSHASMPGIDFYSVARGWHNLLEGRSEFDSFHSAYGPYSTWLAYHPLLAVVIGAPLTLFSPGVAYAVWTAVSAAILALSGWLIAQRSTDPLRRALAVLLLLGSFPGFILWQSGNVQATLVLSFVLILVALDGMCAADTTALEADRRYRAMLLAGLLISLFSKPAVIVLLPLLLLMKETRRTAILAIALYIPVSLLSWMLPAWNPIALSPADRLSWFTHPGAIAQTMNVYTNGFNVTRPMMDNAAHWFAMVGLTDFRFLHIDIYSLSALLDGWLGTHTSGTLYRVPVLLLLQVSFLAALVRHARARMHAALLVAMAGSVVLILSYGVVWEYHYTLVLPVVAMLFVRGCSGWVERAIVVLGTLSWLPSLYIFMRLANPSSLHVQTILRAERVVPVALIFSLLLSRAVSIALRHPDGLRFLTEPLAQAPAAAAAS